MCVCVFKNNPIMISPNKHSERPLYIVRRAICHHY